MMSGAAEQAFLPATQQPQSQPPSLPHRADHAEVPEAEAHGQRPDSDESPTQQDAELVDLIKGYLQDPAFQEEVEHVAQLWDIAEAQLLAEQGGSAAAGMDLGD